MGGGLGQSLVAAFGLRAFKKTLVISISPESGGQAMGTRVLASTLANVKTLTGRTKAYNQRQDASCRRKPGLARKVGRLRFSADRRTGGQASL